MKAIKKYETILAAVVCFFLIIFPFVTGFHVEELSGMAEEYFAKKSGYEIDLFQYWKEIVLVVFSVFLLILLVLGAVLSFIIEEIIPERYRIDRRTAVLILLFFLLNVLSCASGEYPEYCIWGLFLDYEGLAAITGYVILFAAGYFLLGTEQGMKMILISLRILALLVIIGCCAECVSGPVFNIEGIARILTPNRYEHLLEEVFLDYNGSVSLTFSNPGYFGGFCALLFPILYGRGLTDNERYLCICDGGLAGGLLFCLIMSGSSGALYAAAVSAAVETAVLFYRKRGRGKYWCLLVCLLVFGLISIPMGKTQIMEGKGIAARVGSSVVNPQYEKDDEFHSLR